MEENQRQTEKPGNSQSVNENDKKKPSSERKKEKNYSRLLFRNHTSKKKVKCC